MEFENEKLIFPPVWGKPSSPLLCVSSLLISLTIHINFWSPNREPSSLPWSQLGVLWFNSILTLSRVSGALCWKQRSKTSNKTRDAPSVLII